MAYASTVGCLNRWCTACALLCTTEGVLWATGALARSQFKTALVGTGYPIQRQPIIGNTLGVPWMACLSWVGLVAQCRACILYIFKWYLYRYPGT